MCFMMVLTFMMFWAPLHFLNVYRFYDETIAYSKYFGDLFFVCHIIAVSRSFVNPIIYAWTNIRFREGLKYFMRCYCFDKTKKTLNESQSRQHTSEFYRLKPGMRFQSRNMDDEKKRAGLVASKTFIEVESPMSIKRGLSQNKINKDNVTTYIF